MSKVDMYVKYSGYWWKVRSGSKIQIPAEVSAFYIPTNTIWKHILFFFQLWIKQKGNIDLSSFVC